jgi:hypothetical protein
MNVIAIKCEACANTGWERFGDHWAFTRRCSVCGGSKVERPPQDQDKAAQRFGERTREDD